ncbi:MAG: hypothetical protein FJ271_02860 [Planctomycetes bacterium]|nr:hypothetical protein [Planctomycetota bacterium]
MNRLYQAALSHFEAKKSEAVATLEVYFQKSVGIGEHSGLLEEIRKWTETLSNAHDALDNLDRYFNADGQPK